MTRSIERKYLHAISQTKNVRDLFTGFLATPSQEHPHRQLLWDFSELSYYCKHCKERIIVDYYKESYKTPREEYTNKLALTLKIHNDSQCRIHEPNWRDYAQRYNRHRRKRFHR